MKRAAIWAVWTLIACSLLACILDKFGAIPAGREEEGGKAIASVCVLVFFLMWTYEGSRKR